MKRFSKLLSLVLALCMILSLFVVSTSAAFEDAAEIQNEEAAAVATALGVVDGYEDGTFGPAKTLTRAEATTLIARMILTPAKAAKLATSSSAFTDVAASNWAAGYITWAAAKGIVAGVGNNQFNPNGTLTVSQFAKMLLVALGYNAENEGFVGASWAVNVQTVADEAGLFEGLDVDVDGDCSRDTAVQMILNTLKGNMVKYGTNGVGITVGDTTISVGASAAEPVYDYEGNTVNQQFYEKYFAGLEFEENGDGTFGRPNAYAWYLDGDAIYEGYAADTLVATFKGYVYRGTLYNAIGSKAYKAISKDLTKLSVFSNGVEVTLTDADLDCIVTDDSDYAYSLTYTASYMYYPLTSSTTEVYVDEDSNVRLVTYTTYLAQAADDYDSDEDELSLDVFGNYFYTEATASGEDDLDLADYAEGDWLLVTMVGSKVMTVAPATLVSGTIGGKTMSSTSLSSITVGGQTYSAASAYDSAYFGTVDTTIGSEIIVILNDNGAFLGLAKEEEDIDTSSYVYISAAEQVGVLSSAEVYAAAYFTDGTYAEISLYSVDSKTDASEKDDAYGWYTYNVNSNGKYVLKSVSTDVTADNTAINSGYVKCIAKNTGVKTTASTKFIVVTYDTEGNTAVNVYTGYANVPDITVATKCEVVNNSYGYAAFVFVKTAEDNVDTTTDSSDYMLIYGDYYVYGVNADSVSYTVAYYAQVNGAAAYPTAEIDLATGFYTKISYDEYGFITKMVKLTESNAATYDDYFTVDEFNKDEEVEISYYSNVLSVNNVDYVLADDCVIYVQTGTYKLTAYSLSKLASKYDGATGFGALYGVLDSSDCVSALYLVY